jgi:hypothetical protein
MDGFFYFIKLVGAFIGFLFAAVVVGKALAWFRREFHDQL